MSTSPAESCRDGSGSSGRAPRARAAGELTGRVSASKGCRPFGGALRKLVAVEENHDWASEGARKPVLVAFARLLAVVACFSMMCLAPELAV